MSIANAAFRADVRRAQRRRESQAAAIKQSVVEGRQVGPYTLYLRPFISTDRLMYKQDRTWTCENCGYSYAE